MLAKLGYTDLKLTFFDTDRGHEVDSCVAKIYLRMVMFTLKNRQQYSNHTDSRQILKEVELNFPSPEANKKGIRKNSV